MASADDFTRANITEDQSKPGFFKVRSPPNVYEVHFGDSKCLPSCQCPDWERTRLPCKHFFAIFKYFPQWNFHNFPEHYRESPFLSLDKNVMFGNSTSSCNPQLCEESITNHHSQNNPPDHHELEPQEHHKPKPLYIDIPKNKRFFRTAATKCRDILNQIKNMTYLTEDVEAVEEVNDMLVTCLEKLKSSAPKSNHLILETKCYEKKPPFKNTKKYKEIPKPLKKKHPYSGRVGEKAQAMKRLFNVSAAVPRNEPPTKKKKKESTPNNHIIEEQLPAEIINEFNEEYFEVENITEITDNSFDESASIVSEEPPVVHSSDDIVDEETDVHNRDGTDNLRTSGSVLEGAAEKQEVIEISDIENDASSETSDTPDIVITKVSSQPLANIVKRRKIILTTDDLNIIQADKELNDSIISACNDILHNQFPNINGLQDTTLGIVFQFDTHTSEFIQVLHTGSRHWVMVSTINCAQREVNYYDSSFKSMTTFTKKQIVSLFPDDVGPTIKVNIQSVQQQTNSVDCGIYSIASAASLLHGENPELIHYDSSLLRPHLLTCIQNNYFHPFPKVRYTGRVRRCAKSIYHLDTSKFKVQK